MTTGTKAERRLRPALRLDDVTAVRRGREVVRVGHLDFGVGSHVLAGANGSGKSTLLAAIAGLIPSTGDICVGDVDARSEGRARIAYLPQDPLGLEHLTVLEAIELARGLVRASARDAVDHVRTVGLEGRERKRLNRLSGGERRLAYIATLLAQEAPVLLLDEPTVGLDASHRRAVRHVLAQAAGTRVVVTASHLPDDLTALGTRVVMLRAGAVVFDGTKEQLLEGGSVLDWDDTLSRWEHE